MTMPPQYLSNRWSMGAIVLSLVGGVNRVAHAQPTAAPAAPASQPTTTPASPATQPTTTPASPATQPTVPPPSKAAVSVSGRVIDSLGRPVRGARVSIDSAPDVMVSTDRKGQYQLDHAPLGASIVVDKDGFVTGLGTVSGANAEEILLLTEAQNSETIEVKGDPPPEAPGGARVDRTEVERIPGTGGDLVRALTAMPGVVNTQLPTSFSGIVIRGSAPQDSKILIDDFEVPLLYHTIGARAIVPVESIASLDYIPGGFGVEYGRAGSGIVSLTTRDGSTDKRSEQAEISVLDGGVLVQGPAGANTQYMAAFRRSTIDLIFPYIIPSSVNISLTEVPHYYDVQARVDHEFNSHWKLSLSTIGSDDAFEIFADKSQNPDKRFADETRFIRLTASAHYHDGPWSNVLALSTMPEEFNFELGTVQFIDIKRLETTLRDEVAYTKRNIAGLTDLTWTLGGEADISRYNIDLALPTPPHDGQMMTQFDPNDVSTKFNGVVWTPDFGTWTSLTAGLDKNIRITTGLRVDGFARSGDVAVQPRGQLEIKLADDLKLRLAAGSYRRPAEYQDELLFSLHPESAKQVIVGAQYDPREGIRIQPSLYYTDRSDLVGTDNHGNIGNFGTGTTYGAELLATMRSGPWFGWLSYSYSHSTRIDYPGAGSRTFEYDQPHNLNVALSWKKGKWQLGGRFELYSGLPYTPVIGSVFNSDTNFYTQINGAPDSERTPLHTQLDLRLDHTWQLGGLALTFFIDVQNVYLNQSVASYSYNYDFSQQFAFKSLPIIPSIGLRGVL